MHRWQAASLVRQQQLFGHLMLAIGGFWAPPQSSALIKVGATAKVVSTSDFQIPVRPENMSGPESLSRAVVLACRQFIQTVLPKMGITATVVDPSDLKALERALDEHVVSLYFSESPTNPYLRQARACTRAPGLPCCLRGPCLSGTPSRRLGTQLQGWATLKL